MNTASERQRCLSEDIFQKDVLQKGSASTKLLGIYRDWDKTPLPEWGALPAPSSQPDTWHWWSPRIQLFLKDRSRNALQMSSPSLQHQCRMALPQRVTQALPTRGKMKKPPVLKHVAWWLQWPSGQAVNDVTLNEFIAGVTQTIPSW